MKVQAPLFISSRLMAAVNVGDQETGGIIHIEPLQTVPGGRVQWNWIIEGRDHNVIGAGSDLGTADLNASSAMAALLGFLSAAAEAYIVVTFHGGYSDNVGLFPAAVNEWAYMNSDELAMLEMELEES